MRKYLILIPALTILLSGCSSVKKTVEQTAAEQAVRTNCKSDKDTCNFLAAQTKMFGQGVTLTSTFKGEQQMEGAVTATRLDGKGNMQSTTTKNGKVEADMIVYNNTTYFKDLTDSKWFKLPSDNQKNEQSFLDMKSLVDDMKNTFKEENSTLKVKKTGQETCGDQAPDLTCVVYEMDDSTSKDLGKSKIWVDTKDNYPRKMETTIGNGTSTITYSYDLVVINEPSPVKDFVMPSIPAFDTSKMPSQEELKKLMQQGSGE